MGISEFRSADAQLGAAIGDAMQRLPRSHKLRLILSRGDIRVCVTSKKGRVVWFDCSDGDIAQAIQCAVEWAEHDG